MAATSSSSSSIVIKVMYGEELTRFTVSTDDIKNLDLNIVTLSDKIRRLFSFGSDVRFSMTYVDEDGDVVRLAHDDDLLEVLRQSQLNPLRITVKLIDDHGKKLVGGSSGTSAPVLGFQLFPESPSNQLPNQTTNYRVSGKRKSVHGRLSSHTTLSLGPHLVPTPFVSTSSPPRPSVTTSPRVPMASSSVTSRWEGPNKTIHKTLSDEDVSNKSCIFLRKSEVEAILKDLLTDELKKRLKPKPGLEVVLTNSNNLETYPVRLVCRQNRNYFLAGTAKFIRKCNFKKGYEVAFYFS